ncbi:AraC family transcriptional regulator [Pseudodesulfovibrio senegalensis]|uniref:GyrI-like domain-containing protein n=1 Tax=Pseudodesulfovibrio senegalensis TaxID=1721087 RepID=A0A6N6MZN5_9BACT|nr:GyrI-like domain-containing protein [Pseudodesulfovibrio senegalensis]KAB1440388.1 GyrI-like domain-containing protein [Pseudodesulfovibrio senegalensis]
MNVDIKMTGTHSIAYVRHTGPYMDCKTAWDELCAWAMPKGLLTPETLFFGIGHDDPEQTPEQDLRYDACITLRETPETEGNVQLGTIPAGQCAVALHVGPYETLGDSWREILKTWLPHSGHQYDCARASFEQYMNDPETTPPQELRTMLFVPIK